MTRSLVAFVFVILVIVIIFLMFQVNDNSTKCREAKTSDQDRLSRASKLLVQSTTQDHPLLSFESAVEARLIMEEILSRHGGLSMSERSLKLPKGRLESLRTKIHEQYALTVEKYPELNFMSDAAGTRVPPPRQSSRQVLETHADDYTSQPSLPPRTARHHHRRRH